MPWRQPEPAPVTPGNQAAAKKRSFGRQSSPSPISWEGRALNCELWGRGPSQLGREGLGWSPTSTDCKSEGTHDLDVPHRTSSGMWGAPPPWWSQSHHISLLGSGPPPSGPPASQLKIGKVGEQQNPTETRTDCGGDLVMPASPTLSRVTGMVSPLHA